MLLRKLLPAVARYELPGGLEDHDDLVLHHVKLSGRDARMRGIHARSLHGGGPG